MNRTAERLIEWTAAAVVAAVTAYVLAAWWAPAPAEGAAYDYRNYLAAGDSITYGIGTSNPPATSYPGQANVKGYGIPGACLVPRAGCPEIRHWLPAYIDSLPNKPNTVVVMIGSNDYFDSTSATITAAMRDLAAIMDRRGVRTVYGTITPAPAGAYGEAGVRGKVVRLAVNDWIRSHAAYRGPEYARALQCGASDLCPEYAGPDNDVHVNDAGAAVMADVLRDWIAA